MLWFFIVGAIVVVLVVYASYESSRAAFFRAKAREIEYRTHGQLVIDVPSSDATRGRYRRESLSRQFDERVSRDVVFQHEDEEENYERRNVSGRMRFSEPEEEGTFVDPISKPSELESVVLDESAISFLNQIGVKAPGPINSDNEEFMNMDNSITPEYPVYPDTTDETSLVVQETIQVPFHSVDRVPFFSEVSLLLCQKVKSGTHYISGQIIEKYADDFCRISDGTGTKILAHARFLNFKLDDVVICQVEVKKSGWDCLHVWKRDVESIRKVI